MSTLRVRRGLEVAVDGVTPADGEPVWASDSKELRVGDGATPGGVRIATQSQVQQATEATRHTHEQPSPSAVWSVVHNLGFRPHVRCEDAVGGTINGYVEDIDENELTVKFGGAISGKAYLSA